MDICRWVRCNRMCRGLVSAVVACCMSMSLLGDDVMVGVDDEDVDSEVKEVGDMMELQRGVGRVASMAVIKVCHFCSASTPSL